MHCVFGTRKSKKQNGQSYRRYWLTELFVVHVVHGRKDWLAGCTRKNTYMVKTLLWSGFSLGVLESAAVQILTFSSCCMYQRSLQLSVLNGFVHVRMFVFFGNTIMYELRIIKDYRKKSKADIIKSKHSKRCKVDAEPKNCCNSKQPESIYVNL